MFHCLCATWFWGSEWGQLACDNESKTNVGNLHLVPSFSEFSCCHFGHKIRHEIEKLGQSTRFEKFRNAKLLRSRYIPTESCWNSYRGHFGARVSVFTPHLKGLMTVISQNLTNFFRVITCCCLIHKMLCIYIILWGIV